MAQHDFQELYDQYPTIIDQMKDKFTSHEFILRLAQQNQVAYIKALNAYCDHSDPFRIVHGQLSNHLNTFTSDVRYIKHDDSDDIFGQPGDCAYWQKK